MKKVITKIVNREEFNKLVLEQEKGDKLLGIKKVEACVFYSYEDEYGNLVKLFCNEAPAKSGHNLQSIS